MPPPREDLPEGEGEALASANLRHVPNGRPIRREVPGSPGRSRRAPPGVSSTASDTISCLRGRFPVAAVVQSAERSYGTSGSRGPAEPFFRSDAKTGRDAVRGSRRDPLPGDPFEPDDEQVPRRGLRDGRGRRERRRRGAPVRDDRNGAEEGAEEEEGAETDALGPGRAPRERRRDERPERADEGRRDEDPPPARRDVVEGEPPLVGGEAREEREENGEERPAGTRGARRAPPQERGRDRRRRPQQRDVARASGRRACSRGAEG